MKIVNNGKLGIHEAKTTGVHGAGDEHLALFGEASQVLNKVVWKDVSEQALYDANRTATLDWTDLDLTALTSVAAKYALIVLVLKIDSISAGAYCKLEVRKNGTTPTYNNRLDSHYSGGNRAGSNVFMSCVIGLDAGQVIEYRLTVDGTIQFDTYVRVVGYIE